MCPTEQLAQDVQPLRIESVDSWHKNWPQVLHALQRAGHRYILKIDQDGWLSARQGLFVAFAEDAVAGYLSFRVRCLEQHGVPARRNGRPVLEAIVECVHVEPQWREKGLSSTLRTAAAEHARNVCEELSGFDAETPGIG